MRVGVVDRAARKDVRAGDEIRGVRALDHEQLRPLRGIAQQDEGRGRAGVLARHRQPFRPARSFAFCAWIISRMRCQSASDSLSSSLNEAPLAR